MGEGVGALTDALLRPATAADAPALARLRFAFRSGQAPVTEGEDAFLPRCVAWMARELAPGGRWRCWVAEVEAELVGTIWLQLIEKLPNPAEELERHGYISSFYVQPAHRGAGLGSRLLDAGLAACLRDGVDVVVLWPTPESRSLYARHGFAVHEDLLARRLPGAR